METRIIEYFDNTEKLVIVEQKLVVQPLYKLYRHDSTNDSGKLCIFSSILKSEVERELANQREDERLLNLYPGSFNPGRRALIEMCSGSWIEEETTEEWVFNRHLTREDLIAMRNNNK